MTCCHACPAHKGDVLKALFHKPLEVVVEKSIDGENVESSLVIGYKHISLVGVDKFTVSYFNLNEE